MSQVSFDTNGFWQALAGPGKRLAEAELLIIPLNRR